tara:strand:+ start:64961 stop:66364 length:1404 start_codon:yes stop_codon:yes gene_type:complete
MKINQLQIILLVFGLPLSLISQTGHGLSFDNYNGIYGSTTNPANTAQSKYRWHVNGLSYNNMGTADFGAIDYIDIEAHPNGFNGLNFNDNIDNSSDNNFMISDSDVMLPSVLYNINDKHAVSLILRSRAFSDYSNFNGQFFADLNNGFETAEGNTFNSTFNNTNHYWGEIGLNYALVLVNSNYHFIKIGGTAKYLMGSQAVEARGTLEGSYTTGTSGNVTFTNVDLVYLKTTKEDLPNESQKFYTNAFENFGNNGSGKGGDIGIVYEWRPRETNRVDVRSNAGAVNTYKLKISAAILDIGSIKYKTTIQKDSLFTNSQSQISTNDISNDGLIKTLKDNPNISENPQQGEVTFALPRSLNIGLDYIIFNDKNYYVNLNYIKSLTKAEDVYTNSRLDLITLTPRYETQKLSVYLPITYEQNSSDIYAGFGVRYGPITIGSAALSSLVTDGKMKHLYFGLNLPLFQEVFR